MCSESINHAELEVTFTGAGLRDRRRWNAVERARPAGPGRRFVRRETGVRRGRSQRARPRPRPRLRVVPSPVDEHGARCRTVPRSSAVSASWSVTWPAGSDRLHHRSCDVTRQGTPLRSAPCSRNDNDNDNDNGLSSETKNIFLSSVRETARRWMSFRELH